MFKAFFFDMDGVLFDSMPHHAEAWEEIAHKYGFDFTARDTYLQEGRTGQDVITECYTKKYGTPPEEKLIWKLYREKTECFEAKGETRPMAGINEVLRFLHSLTKPEVQIWVVTGSGQQSLFDKLNHIFPNIFYRERMVTAYDVLHGKPDPEPYLKAWQQSGLTKEECVVIENAPLGIVAGKKAGLFTIGVNTGILQKNDLAKAGADIVLDDMYQLARFMQIHRHIEQHILPLYNTFDKGHNCNHARKVIQESLLLAHHYDVDPLMVYTIAAYHDTGLQIDREHHHINSGIFLANDTALHQWFNNEQIQTMQQAVEDHRASSKQAPRSIYGCIVAEADRDIDAQTILRRTMQYGMHKFPELTFEQQMQRTLEHLHNKYAEGGYIRLWLHSERNENGLKRLREIINDNTLLQTICLHIYEEEKNQSPLQ
ncbi:MAG: HAD-IA family hydrolase [Paludibacter sp.]|nr:HAD-IA family hydrolase [Bacteroidales bacterium]MCM1069678.1 HAD-IA family hydrolase [Prevotella sp.]MCM1354324.1 HAD-IA family hydrolase [Bacteroides sp.]MCM1443137.1 HAD-IA family hydrolase [Muribaculum sp.]MCM1482372.1 HAD-IA family hydrolase [Paludibacter sp.]